MASQYVLDYGDETLRRMNNLYAKLPGMPLRKSIDASNTERGLLTWNLTNILIAELDRIAESGEVPLSAMVSQWNTGKLSAEGFHEIYRKEMIDIYEILRKSFSKEDIEKLGFR
ncbi:MAG: hypothetical protein HGA85_06590 [Nanoarchaeota archaeon]|nr:hypothetical protein [Nanoarchaeota archaeon]